MVGADVFEGVEGRVVGAGGADLVGGVLGAAEGGEEVLGAGVFEPGEDVDGGEAGVVEGGGEVGGGEAVGQEGLEEVGLFGGGEGGLRGEEHGGNVQVWVVVGKWVVGFCWGIDGSGWGDWGCAGNDVDDWGRRGIDCAAQSSGESMAPKVLHPWVWRTPWFRRLLVRRATIGVGWGRCARR